MSVVYLHEGWRTPFQKSATDYYGVRNVVLAADLLKFVAEKVNSPLVVRIFGSTINRTETSNLARDVAKFAGLDETVPDVTVSAAGASGAQAVFLGVSHLLQRPGSSIISAADVMGDLPVSSDFILGHALMKARSGDWWEFIRNLVKVIPKMPPLADYVTHKSMGAYAEQIAKDQDISREDQDSYAIASHANYFRNLEKNQKLIHLTPWNSARQDNGARKTISRTKIESLKPVFSEVGTVTAANATFLTDGAASLVLSTEPDNERIAIIDHEFVGMSDHEYLLGPTRAIPTMLSRHNLSHSDVDVWEIHEAFAVQIIGVLRILAKQNSFDFDKVNAWGGSLAVGNPFSPNVLRLLSTARQRMIDGGFETAVVSTCSGGGLGASLLLKRVGT